MPDTHAAYRELEPQVAVMGAASGLSRTIDTRRPRKLTAAQRAQVERHPEESRLESSYQGQVQNHWKREREADL